MKRQSLYFHSPRHVEIREERISEPGRGQVLVAALVSAISPGTEMLVYRGEAPADMPADETISALSGQLAFPLKYGYALVGRVTALGPGVDPAWENRLVFTFHPHESHFLASLTELIPVPAGLSPEQGVFLPNMETAVNLVHDGRPLLGEQVLIFGQGVVGLLTSALLVSYPLRTILAFDRYETRRAASLGLGVHHALGPDQHEEAQAFLAADREYPFADLSFELSGAPAALNQAIALTGFGGRIVIGSWYGIKQAALNLGGRFHRSRITLISSQVTTLNPELSGRWSKARRINAAWDQIKRVCPERFITHRFPFEQAPSAYQLLDEAPTDAIQVLLTYP